jgi:hypothetical protein
VDGRGRCRGGTRPSARRRCPPPSATDIAAEVVPPPAGHKGAGSNDKKPAGRPSRSSLGRSRGGLTSTIHLAADTRCRPVSRLTTAGQRHDWLAVEPVMAGIRIRHRGRARPRTRPCQVLGLLQPGHPLSPAAMSDQRRDPGARRPAGQPATPEPQGRAAPGLRPTQLQAAQRRRARHQQAQGPPRGWPPATTSALHVPRNHRRRLDQNLAPRPRLMIHGTGSNRVPHRWISTTPDDTVLTDPARSTHVSGPVNVPAVLRIQPRSTITDPELPTEPYHGDRWDAAGQARP